ncbi:hypothetical protein [Fodinicola acaciae]|uniref:hypothetical protein n=1 Tax=Fodinicola acaciae TaxID=2681555 RepID=UPI0013D6678B|nr:hypothetical protein [Fodinicola acaciae]
MIDEYANAEKADLALFDAVVRDLAAVEDWSVFWLPVNDSLLGRDYGKRVQAATGWQPVLPTPKCQTALSPSTSTSPAEAPSTRGPQVSRSATLGRPGSWIFRPTQSTRIASAPRGRQPSTRRTGSRNTSRRCLVVRMWGRCW